MNKSLSIIAIVFSCIALFKVFSLDSASTSVGNAEPQFPVYERVIERKKLNLGYLVYPPYIDKSSDGELSGIYVDFAEMLGENLNMGIEWVEEIALATLSTSLNKGNIDLVAFPLWRSGARAKTIDFGAPMLYATVGTYVRASDNRFDESLKSINDKSVRIATIDGEMAENIAKADFPQAQQVSLTTFSDYTQLLLEVANNKADVTFFNRVFANRYMASNPDTIKEIHTETPVRVFAEALTYPKGDYKFSEMINNATQELIDNGALRKVYEANKESIEEYYQLAPPFQSPK